MTNDTGAKDRYFLPFTRDIYSLFQKMNTNLETLIKLMKVPPVVPPIPPIPPVVPPVKPPVIPPVSLEAVIGRLDTVTSRLDRLIELKEKQIAPLIGIPWYRTDEEPSFTLGPKVKKPLFQTTGEGKVFHIYIRTDSLNLGVSLNLDDARVEFKSVTDLYNFELDMPVNQGWWISRYAIGNYAIVLTPSVPYQYRQRYNIELTNTGTSTITVQAVRVLRQIISVT